MNNFYDSNLIELQPGMIKQDMDGEKDNDNEYILNISEYESWDIDTTIKWIKSLDNGRYIKYCHILRKGFESDGIPASELPNVVQADLRADPFNIQSFVDRKKLAEHFKSLKEGDGKVPLSDDAPGGASTKYI